MGAGRTSSPPQSTAIPALVRTRPGRVGILAWICVAAGVLTLTVGLIAVAGGLNAAVQFVGAAIAIMGLLSLSVAYGLRLAKTWVWALATWMGVAYTVLGVVFLAGISSLVFGTLMVVYGAGTAYYIRRPEVRKYLGRR